MNRRTTVLTAGLGGAAIVTAVGLALWQPWDDDTQASPSPADEQASDGTAGDTPPPASVAPDNQVLVSNTDDGGDGSLRDAIDQANSLAGSTLITFDNQSGTFDDPQTIVLDGELPEITGEVDIDGYIPDRLWEATGVTISGGGQSRVLTVASGGSLTLRSLTIADGAESDGGGILNEGRLVLHGVTMMNNTADGAGGGVANEGGQLTIVNSTFTLNNASTGGGVSGSGGRVEITHGTFSENGADEGGGLFSDGDLVVANTILANSAGGDCVSTSSLVESTNNLIEEHDGCGEPISSADPSLEVLGYYNGPSQTLPLRGGSPAINLGANAAAVNEFGEELDWDQRGNGDPRFVAGFADIGAFEHQAFPDLTVDTLEDIPLRACSAAGTGDCPLRAAIELANATPEPDVIIFDTALFAGATTIDVAGPLPQVTEDLTIDASDTGGVNVPVELNVASGVDLELVNVEASS